VGKVPHNGPLQPGQSCSASLTAALPAVTPGQYYAIVRADILNNVRESDENNNAGVSAKTMAADVVELTLGQPYQSQLNNGTEHYYKVNVPNNQVMSVTLNAAETNKFNELFTRFGAMPDRGTYDFLYSVPWEPDQTIVVPDTQAGYYYHLARGEYVPQPPTPYTIKAELVPFSITSVSPTHIGDNGQVTVTLHGALFQDGSSVQLMHGTNMLVANNVMVLDSATAKARFYLTNALKATYDVVLSRPDAQTTTAAQALRIEPALPLTGSTAMSGNQTPRGGQPTAFRCAARNTANVDAPYFLIHATVQGAATWSLRRPASTFPQSCSTCVTNPASSTIDYFTDASGGFIARDVGPGEEVIFALTIDHVTTQTTVTFASEGQSADDFAHWLADLTEWIRQSLLANGTVRLPLPFSSELGDPIAWKSEFLQGYVALGLLDASESTLFLYATFERSSPWSPNGTRKVAQSCEEQCNDINKLCWVTTIGGGVSCFVECAPAIGVNPVVGGVCVALCLVNEGIKHHMCTLMYKQCVITCRNLNCLLAIADGDTSGGDVCPQYPRDPNEIQGPVGYGSPAYVGMGKSLLYTIYFENVTNATATARQIQIINQLDPSLDSRTVRILQVGFGDYRLEVPDNRSFYQARVQLDTNFNNLLADISAGVDIQNQRVVWTLTAIDPNTGEQPQSTLLGLLPPNDTNHVGEGYVSYTVQPVAGTPTGTVITNKATIIFDNNEPLDTNPWWNTVDSGAPTSAVSALPPSSTNTTFTVSWFGVDDSGGSEVSTYDVFVSDNGGTNQLWQTGTMNTTASYTGQRGHTYAFYSVATDNVGNREADHTTPDAFTTITNHPPVLASIPDQIANVGTQLVVNLKATDLDLPDDQLTFLLGTNAPSGMTINPMTGQILWTPTAAQAGITNLVTVTVYDGAGTNSNDSKTFAVVVVTGAPPNTAPVLAPIADRTINAGQRLWITNSATDSDLPPQTLTFSLADGAPKNLSLDPVTGLLGWRPTSAQGGTTNLISVVVSDNGSPSMSATQSFTVIVVPIPIPTIVSVSSTNVSPGSSSLLHLSLASSEPVTNLTFHVQVAENRLTNLVLVSVAPGVAASSFSRISSNLFQATFATPSNQPFAGAMPLGDLSFLAVSNVQSAIVPVAITNVLANRQDGAPASATGGLNGQVFVIGDQPILEALLTTNHTRNLVLHGKPGVAYGIEYKTNLTGSGSWAFLTQVQMTTLSLEITNTGPNAPAIFYRAYQSLASPGRPTLEAVLTTNRTRELILHGTAGLIYAIEYRTNLVSGTPWTFLTEVQLITSSREITNTGPNTPVIFYRAYQGSMQPTLTTVLISNQMQLTLCGQPGKTYRIEYMTNQASGTPWMFMADVVLNSPCLELGRLMTNTPAVAYRVVENTNGLRLVAALAPGQARKLTLCGEPGKTYYLEYKTNLTATLPWRFLAQVAQTNYCQDISNVGVNVPVIFYRAYEQIPSRLLQMRREGGNYVIEWPAAYLLCGLEETTTLSPSATWLPSAAVIQQSGDKLLATVPVGTTSKFYRLRCSQ
jgi:hypothetical protein